MKRDWGNISQVISALCALSLALLAFYGVFFSKTSQALVSYLQSELAVRNQRIANLEGREQQLQMSVKDAEANLEDLAKQKEVAQKKIAALDAEQEALTQKITNLDSTLSNTKFSLVREKINTTLSSTINGTSFFLEDRLEQADGVAAVTERPWDDKLAYIKKIAANLPEPDRDVGAQVVAKFAQQCGRYSKIAIQIPALRIPKGTDYSPYGYDRSKHPTAVRLRAIAKQLENVEKEIEKCFRSVTP